MAFTHGKNTSLWFDGRDLTPFFHEFTGTFANDTAETTVFQNAWKTFIPGLNALDVSGSGYFDPTMTDLTDALTATPNSVLTYGLGGLTQGALSRLVPIRETAFEEGANIGEAVGFSWAAISTGIPGLDGRVLAPLAAVTIDQNGTAVDNGAATTTGAIAHLHVTSVSASDSIVVTIEDSATGSSGWATIGTFASKSAAGAERIVIAGTIRRYTRAVDDVTGAAVSIIRGVALART
jgi:hypothetical protein